MPAALSKTLLVNLIITQSAAELRLHMLPAAQKMLTYFHSWQLHFLSFCRFQNVTQYYAEVQNCSRGQNTPIAHVHIHTATHTRCAYLLNCTQYLSSAYSMHVFNNVQPCINKVIHTLMRTVAQHTPHVSTLIKLMTDSALDHSVQPRTR